MNAIPDPLVKSKEQSESIHEYLNLYVQQIVGSVRGRQSCLLLGPLGAGKTDVIHASALQLQNSGLARCVVMNVGEETQLTPESLWTRVLKALDVPLLRRRGLVNLRAQIQDWLQHQNRDLVLMLDQVELLERTGPIFDDIRAMVMETAHPASDDDDRGKFVTVLSSTEALRRDLTSPHSPLHNILTIIRMLDCDPALREAIWGKVLAAMPPAQQRSWMKELYRLCAGDPYQIMRVAEILRRDLPAMLQSGDTDEQMVRLFAEFNANPAQVAPLLRRHGEQVENDAWAASTMLELLQGRRVPAQDAPFADNDSVRSGIFHKNPAGDLTFRSGLTERFFRNEFERRPERVAHLLMRQEKYEQAIQYLALHKQTGRDVTSVLRDVCLAWVRTARSPSRAWDTAARALSLWFGEGVTVLRCVPRWRTQDRPQHYVQVRDGVYDLPAGKQHESLARAAYRERTEFQANDIVLKPIPFFTEPPDACYVFPMQHSGSEYGAIILSREAHVKEFAVARGHDHLDSWIALLRDVFGEIIDMEQELLSNVDLASVQRLAQENRALEDTDWVLGMLLAAITAGFGLKFNRCVLLQAAGGARLAGRAAVGFHSQAGQERAWHGNIPQTFADWLNQYPARSDLSVTPLGRAARKLVIGDWRNDAVLGPALDGDATLAWPAERIAQSALGPILRLDGESVGDPYVFIMPLWDASTLAGALVLDRPFTRESVTQEQLDLLPGFANQIVLTLGNERIQRDYHLFDALNAATQKRLLLQDTLDAISKTLLDHLKGLVSQLVITLWDHSPAPSPSDPDRRQSTVRLAQSATRDDLIDDWQYHYYTGKERCCGPIDQALFAPKGRLYIPRLRDWLAQQKPDAGPRFTRGMHTTYSVAMQTSQPTPLGVISFQSRLPDAFNDVDRQLLDRVAARIAGMVDKARVYEGLSNARHHTDQLNEALSTLMQQKTRADLHDHIARQTSNFFFGDGHTAHHHLKPDSVALFAIDRGKLAVKVAGVQPGLAELLACECDALLDCALAGQPVFIENAASERVAREAHGDAVCRRHAQLGAQASVWCTIGDDLLLVLAWERPRRISTTERESLPVLTAIAARTNGVIERDRQIMKAQLDNSLALGDYEMIEAEFTHQWNKRIRHIRQNAQYALEDLANESLPASRQRENLESYLKSIRQYSIEGLERLSFNSKMTRTEEILLRAWLASLVERWNILNRGSAPACMLSLQLPEDATLRTRPVILQWILNELLGNALDAELRLRDEARHIELSATHHPHRREYEISISNNARLPRDVLDAIRSGRPIDRPKSAGRGIWIAAGQVRALLNGTLTPPDPQDARTTFTITLSQ